MSDLILKKEVVDKIKKDPELFGKVMKCLDKTPSYGLQMLNNNDLKLTQASVLRILRQHLEVELDSALLTEEETVAPKRKRGGLTEEQKIRFLAQKNRNKMQIFSS